MLADVQAIDTCEKKRKIPAIFSFFAVAIVVFAATWVFISTYAFDAKIKNIGEIGINDTIEINFNQPVLSMSSNSIKISPDAGFYYRLSQNKEVLVITPLEGGFEFEKKYTITLKGVRGLNGLIMDGKELVFYTKEKTRDVAAKLASAESDNETFGNIELSKNKYVPPESSRVKEDFRVEPHIIEGKYIDVSLSHQVMTIFEDGRKINQFLVSTGRWGMPTPQGEFSVLKKIQNAWSAKYGLWMPYSMNFSGPYYIHELPYWPGGYREGENHLGVKVSHGCIRLGIGPAKYVYDWADVGTPVYIHE